MKIRTVLFWLHLAAGCVAGLIILVMSVTGVLLTYEKQILARLERTPVRIAAPPSTPRLGMDALAAAARAELGNRAAGATLTLRSDPHEPAEIRAGREGGIYVDPYSGRVLAKTGGGAAQTFQKITAWHRWLGLEGPGRTAARAITGACNLCFLFIVVSGAYLWLPRRWSWQSVRAVLWFRGAKGKARDFNWHNVFGIWALLPLFLIVLGALPISYTWANNLVYRITGSPLPPAPPRPGGPAARPSRPIDPGAAPDLDRLWDRAQRQVPGWQSITARLSPPAHEPVAFTIDTGNGGQPQKRSTLLLDPATGNVVRRESFSDGSAGRRLRTWMRFVHTGEYYGVIGQTVAGLASLAGVMLVWTGISLALRRFSGWTRRRGRRGAGVPAPSEPAPQS